MMTRTILSLTLTWAVLTCPAMAQDAAKESKKPATTETPKAAETKSAAKPKEKPDPTKRVIPIAARNDMRVHLFATIFRLADCPEYAVAGEVPLANKVDTYFKDHKDHPAIAAAKDLWQKQRVGFDDIMYLALNVDSIDSLKLMPAKGDHYKRFEMKWPKEKTDVFLKHAREWVVKAEFKKQMAENEEALKNSTEKLKAKTAKQTYIAWFRHFFGFENPIDYHAVAGMLNGPYTYVVPSARAGNKTDLFIIPGVLFADREGAAMFEDDFDRSVVDALTLYGARTSLGDHAERIAPDAQKLYDQITDKMQALGIYNGKALVQESIARAAAIRYVENAAGRMAGSSEMYRHKGLGFLWIDELALLLRDYEADRKTYPDLDAFAPKIAKFFKEWSKMHIADADRIAKGPILRMFSRPQHEGDVILVEPDVFPDPGTEQGVLNWVRGQWEALFKNQFVSKPTPAKEITEAQKKTRALIVYGSPSSNVVLKEIFEKLNISMTKKSLTISGKTYEGSNIILITILPSPYNKEKPVLIYAAYDDNYIMGLDAFLHGPSDFLIGQWGPRDEPIVVMEGDYTKRPDGKWFIK